MRHLLLLLALTASAQTLSFSQLPAGAAPPSPRFDGTIAYDPTGGQLFLFGGQDSVARNDLWAYSLQQNQWREVQPIGSKPVPRFGHTLVLDSARRRLILFAGQAAGLPMSATATPAFTMPRATGW